MQVIRFKPFHDILDFLLFYICKKVDNALPLEFDCGTGQSRQLTFDEYHALHGGQIPTTAICSFIDIIHTSNNQMRSFLGISVDKLGEPRAAEISGRAFSSKPNF